MSILSTVSAFSRAKLILLGGVLAAIVFVVLYILSLKGDIKELTTERNTLSADKQLLIANNTTLKYNFSVCEDVNKTNQATIDLLNKERAEAELAVAELAEKDLSNAQAIANLKKQLELLNNDAANNGAVATNLRETIRSIQQGRKDQE